MLTMRYWISVILASLVFVAPASSQESSNHKAITQKEQKAEQKKGPPDNKSALIEERKAESITNASEQPKAHTNEKLEIDRSIAEYTRQLSVYTENLSSYTFWLVIATVVLGGIGVYQGVQLQRSVSLARDEFVATHRPKLIVRRLLIKRARGIGIGDIPGIEFIVANIGRTKATIVERAYATWIPPAGETLPAIPPYGESDMTRLTLESGQSFPLIYRLDGTVQHDFSMAEGFANEISSELAQGHYRNPIVAFLGYVLYIDDTGRQRRTAFLRYYNFSTKRFNASDDPDYEYQD